MNNRVWLYIDKIYDCLIDTVCEGFNKHMTIRCEYVSDGGLHNISMRLRYVSFGLIPPDDGSREVVGVLNIAIYFDKVVIVFRGEHGGIGTIIV